MQEPLPCTTLHCTVLHCTVGFPSTVVYAVPPEVGAGSKSQRREWEPRDPWLLLQLEQWGRVVAEWKSGGYMWLALVLQLNLSSYVALIPVVLDIVFLTCKSVSATLMGRWVGDYSSPPQSSHSLLLGLIWMGKANVWAWNKKKILDSDISIYFIGPTG